MHATRIACAHNLIEESGCARCMCVNVLYAVSYIGKRNYVYVDIYIKKQAPFSSVPTFIYILNISINIPSILPTPLERVISLLTCAGSFQIALAAYTHTVSCFAPISFLLTPFLFPRLLIGSNT